MFKDKPKLGLVFPMDEEISEQDKFKQREAKLKKDLVKKLGKKEKEQ